MMLSGRPLLPTKADRRYLLERPEVDVVLRNVRARINTLLVGDRGSGKTTTLRNLEQRIEEELQLTTIYIDARRLDDATTILNAVRDAILGPRNITDEAARNLKYAWASTPAEVRGDDALRAIRELTNDTDAERACVLLDDPDPGVAHRLFGRLRDELWQTGIVWVVAADRQRREEFLTPPADAFFERVVTLGPLADAQQRELIKRRLARGDDPALLDVRAASGSPRALLASLRDAASAEDAQSALAVRADRQQRASNLGRLESMMLAEIEDGAAASASDPEWLGRFGVSRQRAQQALSKLERSKLVRADTLPGTNGRPRKVFRRLELGA